MESWDYIVVGSGAAGSILANRLSEDLKNKILVIEAGGSDKSLFISMPSALPFVYQNKKISWNYQSGPEPYLNQRLIDEKAGKIIGGSTSINAMICNRGNPMDFEGWAAAGLKEWDYARVLPYFKRLETWAEGENEWRGTEGPMKVNRAYAKHHAFQNFLEAGIEAGFEITKDHNGYKQEGLHIAQVFIHKGVRWSAPKGYLYPALNRPNLTLLRNSRVNKVLIENQSAKGVEVEINGKLRRIIANKEIILAAGALNSPKILMHSGVGEANYLSKLGIKVKSDRHEVGKNLQNHPGVDLQFHTEDKNSLTSQLTLMGRAKLAKDWLLFRKGLGTSNFFEGGAFLRTRPDVAFPNMQYEFLPLTRKLVNGKVTPVSGFQFWLDLSRPKSRGEIKLKSADIKVQPSIIFNHYQEEQDLKDMVDGVKLARFIVEQKSLAKINLGEMEFSSTAKSDSQIREFIRERTGTSYHPSGACRMGSDLDAVVDQSGRVNSITNLRVVDASIMPIVITGNLNTAVMMMAEKISDDILGKIPLTPNNAPFYKI